MPYKYERVSSGEYSYSTVRKKDVQGCNKALEESKTLEESKDVDVSDVDDTEENKGKSIN